MTRRSDRLCLPVRSARPARPALLPLGAIAAGFGFGLSLAPAMAQTIDPTPGTSAPDTSAPGTSAPGTSVPGTEPPGTTAPATSGPPAEGTATPPAASEATLPTVSVKGAAEESAKETLQTTTTTIGKGRQEIRDIPQAITVVTEKLLDDVKLDTLRQALHYTSGITFAATENGTDQDIRLRGFPVATTGDLLI
ncbi:MAG: TonB-dependent receptor plug domain-containing protein, partial [Lautropia sp.]